MYSISRKNNYKYILKNFNINFSNKKNTILQNETYKYIKNLTNKRSYSENSNTLQKNTLRKNFSTISDSNIEKEMYIDTDTKENKIEPKIVSTILSKRPKGLTSPSSLFNEERAGERRSKDTMWTKTSATSSIHAALPIIPTRIQKAVYIESLMPSDTNEDEFISTDYYLSPEYVEDYSMVARDYIGTIEHLTHMSEQTKVLETGAPIAIMNLGKEHLFHRFFEISTTIPFQSCIIVPIFGNNKIYAILRLYLSTKLNINNHEYINKVYWLVRNIISAGIYGATTASTELEFRQYNPDVSLELQYNVYIMIINKGLFKPQRCFAEVDYFFSMGVDTFYFQRFDASVIANHVQAYIAAKYFSIATDNPQDIWLAIENNIKFMGGLQPEQSQYMIPYENRKIVAVERYISKRIRCIPITKSYTLDTCVTKKPLVSLSNKKMVLYILETTPYKNEENIGNENCTDIYNVSSKLFLKERTKEEIEQYEKQLKEATSSYAPISHVYPENIDEDGTILVRFAFRYHDHADTATDVMLTLLQLLQQQDITFIRKTVEAFSNHIVVFSIYLSQPTTHIQISKFMKQFSMQHLVPKTELLTPKFLQGKLSAGEYTYLTAATSQLFYVTSQRSDEYNTLTKLFKNDQLNLGRQRTQYTNLRREAVSHSRITRIMLKYPELIHKIYRDFETRTTSIYDSSIKNINQETEITKTVKGSLDLHIFNSQLQLNRSIVRTNFFRTTKAAISFRIQPQFFIEMDLPEQPYGVFFIMGSNFQGFHVRFADVARGGIRLIRSRDEIAYAKNLATQFQETYNLAFTQNLKNKDIPEFGSKGTILLHRDTVLDDALSFKRYIAAMVDLLVMNEGITDPEEYIVDNYGLQELLFLGPDEGTAGYMNWAAHYAKDHGYIHWNSFTTGKSAELGGIPHDKFGMTTASVHRYVIGCIQKLGLKEEDITKIQTGGPDGDLGSNEILISKDKTIAIIDGSGVVYDPDGLNRNEQINLALERKTISNYNRTLLSDQGFFVDINDRDIVLPNGEKIESGLQFRNDFHLHPLATCDLFMPCGGRPESVNQSNVQQLFNTKTNKPKFKIIVEGANQFFSQDARLVLDEAGVVLYKDASTNKGGVTSSSLEVLAALVLDKEQFKKHFTVQDGVIPKFYLQYVQEIKNRIVADAGNEFECIWRENIRTNIPRFLLTDKISNKINQLNISIASSSLWDDINLRATVLSEALPKCLQELVTLDAIMKNCPSNYLKAVFCSYLGSRFVYKYGIDASEFSFYEFMSNYNRRSQYVQESDHITIDPATDVEQIN